MQGTYNFLSLHIGKKITLGQFAEVSTQTILMKRLEAMAMAKTQPEGLFFDNCTGISVQDILPYDNTNKVLHDIDRNILGVEW